MVIFHSYVKLPEGTINFRMNINFPAICYFFFRLGFWISDISTAKTLGLWSWHPQNFAETLRHHFQDPIFRFMGSMLNLGPARTTRTDEPEYIIHDFPCFLILSQKIRGKTPGHHRSSICAKPWLSPSKMLQCPWPIVAWSEVKMQTLKQRPLVRTCTVVKKPRNFGMLKKETNSYVHPRNNLEKTQQEFSTLCKLPIKSQGRQFWVPRYCGGRCAFDSCAWTLSVGVGVSIQNKVVRVGCWFGDWRCFGIDSR